MIKKLGSQKFEVSVGDKDQNILSGDLMNEKFEMTSYLKIESNDLRQRSIDMNADGTYDLISRQTEDTTDTKFLFEGQWYPYKGEKGKWMIQTPDGWREIVKGTTGFQFR